jgi:hypothetical protein
MLFEIQSKGTDVHNELTELMNNNTVPKVIIKKLKEQHYPAIEFYITLNNKAHKIIKEVLCCENKPVSNYIKMATSIITQATITLEHMNPEDIVTQNTLIENLHLPELSKALNIYFTEGNYTPLVNAIKETRADIKAILDD